MGSDLTTSRLRQHRQLPVVQHVRFMPLKMCLKTQSQWHAQCWPRQLATHLECAGANFNIHVCTDFELGPDSGDIQICWLNFNAVAQGNAYIPTSYHIYAQLCINYFSKCTKICVIVENANEWYSYFILLVLFSSQLAQLRLETQIGSSKILLFTYNVLDHVFQVNVKNLSNYIKRYTYLRVCINSKELMLIPM